MCVCVCVCVYLFGANQGKSGISKHLLTSPPLFLLHCTIVGQAEKNPKSWTIMTFSIFPLAFIDLRCFIILFLVSYKAYYAVLVLCLSYKGYCAVHVLERWAQLQPVHSWAWSSGRREYLCRWCPAHRPSRCSCSSPWILGAASMPASHTKSRQSTMVNLTSLS